MNLKPVIAALGVLGFIGLQAPAFADAERYSNTTITKTSYGKPKNVSVLEEGVRYKGYKGEVPVCTVNQSTLVLASMTQNMGRALPNPCNPDWFNRISLSGGVNVDLGKWGNRNANYMGENYQRLSLNDAYFNITAIVNDWARAFASISYNTATINDPDNSTTTQHVAEYNAAYDDNVLDGGSHKLQLEQAYITLSNFDVSPLFIQVGKQFADFSRYPLHPITESLTQVMSKTLATAGKVGFIANGFNGSLYIFDNPINEVGQTKSSTNYGAALGYEMADNHLGYALGIAYMHNLMGVNDIAYNVNQFNINRGLNQSGYHTRVGGLALYGDINAGPFYLGLRFTEAVSRFSALDLPENGTFDIDSATGDPIEGADGARPWALGIQGAYGFCGYYNMHQTIYAGYQASRDAAGLNLPRHRWLLGYNVDVWTSTNLAIEWDHDIAYSESRGGIGDNTNLVSLRIGVEFA